METVYRKMDLDTVFPIQSVKDGLIVSKLLRTDSSSPSGAMSPSAGNWNFPLPSH